MRAKKAKAIRNFVRENVPLQEETVYNDYDKVQFLRVPDEKNPQIIHDVRTKGTPCTMGECQRSVCKSLKKIGGIN